MKPGDLIYHEDWEECGIILDIYSSVLFGDDRLVTVLLRGNLRRTDVLLSSLKKMNI
jgi:hypothetical protein